MTTDRTPSSLPRDASDSQGSDSRVLQSFVTVAALGCITLGALALAGWALDVAVLKSVGPAFSTMKADTALAFVLSGMALWQLRRSQTVPVGAANRAAQAAALFVFIIGTLGLGKYLYSSIAGIHRLFLHASAGAVGISPLGRMALNAALAFVAAGIALLLSLRRTPGHHHNRGQSFVEGAAVIVTVIGLLSFVDYAANLPINHSWGIAFGESFPAAVGFVLLGVGLFAVGWRGDRRQWSVGKGETAAFVVVIGAMFVFVGSAYRATRHMAVAAEQVALENDARFRGSDLLAAVQDIETAARGYVITGRNSYLAPYAAATTRLDDAMAGLRRLTLDSREQQSRLDTLQGLITARVQVARDVIEARRLRGDAAAADLVRRGTGKGLMDSIRRQLAALDAATERQTVERQAVSVAATSQTYVVLQLGGAFTLVVLPLVMLALNREVVARGLAVMVARRSEERFRAAFEQTAIGFALVAPDGRFLRVNSKLCDIAGYSREELEARRFQDLTHPDDLAGDLAFQQGALSGGQREYTRDRRYVCQNGSVVWVNLNVSLVPHTASTPPYFIAAVTDITERRQQAATIAASEERFRLAAAATRDTIWDWNIATDEVWRSVDAPRHYGYREASAPSEAWYIAHIHPDDRERVQREMNTTLHSSSTVWESEYRFERADGSAAVLRDRAYVVRANDGTATRLIGSTSDVTEQVELESHMQQIQRMETVGQLAGGLAHDFNNLLTVIIGTADMAALDRPEHESTRKDFIQIRDTAMRAAELTRQLLAFSRRQVLQPKVVSLNALVAATVPMLRRLLGEHIALVVEPAGALGSVFVDAAQMQQVILNLVLNARDAMPNGGTLTIATEDVVLDETFTQSHEGTHGGPHVVLSVRDDGIGMDEQTRQRIFEPFFTTKAVGKGTGLGLATVYGTVKQSNGYILVHSAPGQGATFRVFLPRVASPVVEQGPDVPPAARIAGQRTILVVEDDEFVRYLAIQMLEHLGYTVLVAADGESALGILASHPGALDLVLTDMVMPGMSGTTLAERVQISHPGTKILFTSGYAADPAALNSALSAGAFFIGKPYSLSDLSQKLTEMLGT